MKKFLEGKKTYITAIVIGLVAAARSLGYEVPDGTLELLAAIGLIAMRAGVQKAGK